MYMFREKERESLRGANREDYKILGLEKEIAGLNRVETLTTEKVIAELYDSCRLVVAWKIVAFSKRRRTDGEDRRIQTAWGRMTQTEELLSKHAVSRKSDESMDGESGNHR
jgi:hypothetical protein